MKNTRNVHLDSFSSVVVETRHINSEKLAEECITYMSETLNNNFFHDVSSVDDREQIVGNIEYFCAILMDGGMIEQFDIIFDKRNNKRSDMDKGVYHLEMRFKQTHCLNFSTIKYTIGYRG